MTMTLSFRMVDFYPLFGRIIQDVSASLFDIQHLALFFVVQSCFALTHCILFVSVFVGLIRDIGSCM